MANDITAVMYKILANSLTTLRETAWGPQVVNRDYQPETREKGDTIEVSIYPESEPYDISPSHENLQPKDTTPSKKSLVLDKWKGDNFHLTDKQMEEIADKANYIPEVIQTKVRGLANAVNSSILAEYVNFYGFVGAPGTTPFSNATDRTAAKDATQCATRLTEQLTPRGNRYALLDANATAEALALPQFSHAEKRGNNNAIEDAMVGNQYGITWLHENGLTTHVAGTAASYLVNGTPVEGDTSIPMDTGSGTFVKGDIVTFAGDTQTYVVTAPVANGGTSLPIYPGLKVAPANNAAITRKASHNVSPVFHRDAITLATRMLTRDTGNPTAVINDPVTGITLRLERVRQRKQTMWELDTLWGVKTFRPEFGLRLVG